MLQGIQRPSRTLFWTLGATLYLVPILLLALQVEGYLLPLCALLYALVGWLVVGRLWPEPAPLPTVEPKMEAVEPKECGSGGREVEAQLEATQRSLVQQKALLQKKDERIAYLESTVRDLSYEIRTLLELERENPKPGAQLEEASIREVHSPYDAFILLQRCIQRAQRLPGVEVEPGLQPPRELFDAFRGERSAIVLLYAPAERRLLFANELVQDACGLDPGTFVRQFDSIVRGGRERWEAAVRGLGAGQEASVRLLLATSSGQSLTLDACLGAIPSGPFRGLVIAILYCE